MSDLPVIMRSAQLDINEFYSISVAEKKDRSSEGFCNIEIGFKNAELPVFSNVEKEYFANMKFDDFHEIEKELVNQINVRDKDKLNKEKSFEVEHLYVDFKYLIIGEKIRNLTKETEESKIPRFDDLYYAIFFLKSGDNN